MENEILITGSGIIKLQKPLDSDKIKKNMIQARKRLFIASWGFRHAYDRLKKLNHGK